MARLLKGGWIPDVPDQRNHIFVLGSSVLGRKRPPHPQPVPTPALTESLLGGHCILLVGYDDGTQRVIFRNSWGLWGNQGYGTLPYAYLLNPQLAGSTGSISWVVSVMR